MSWAVTCLSGLILTAGGLEDILAPVSSCFCSSAPSPSPATQLLKHSYTSLAPHALLILLLACSFSSLAAVCGPVYVASGARRQQVIQLELAVLG